jgi:transposase
MGKADRLINEQEHHKKAFEFYCALGEKRSHRQVAQQMDVSLATVKLWSRSFQWRERVGAREAEVARRVADRTLQSEVDEQDRNKRIVRMALVRLAKAIADGKVRFQLSDLDRMIRLQSYLEGPPKKPWTVDDMADELTEVDVRVLRATVERLKEESRKLQEADKNQPESTKPAV